MRMALGAWFRRVAVAAAMVAVLAPVGAPAEAAAADDGSRPGDPALSVEPAAVHAAMVCQGPLGGGGKEPVLLVHGSFVTPGESFGWNYLPELAARGYRVCTVQLPNRSMNDIQVAAEWVVVAVHRLNRETGRKVDVLGHSQGVLQVRWAVKWWPSVQAQVDDLVSLAGPNQGTTVAASPLIALSGCPACIQMAPGSAFLSALNRGDQSPGDVSYTSIYSTLVDELITPNATAPRIEGASNLEVQALCAARLVTHVTILADAVVFGLVTDALIEPGPATAARFNPAGCFSTSYIGLPGTLGGLQTLLSPSTPLGTGTLPVVEPPLKPYAQPEAATKTTTTSATTAAATRTASSRTEPASARQPAAVSTRSSVVASRASVPAADPAPPADLAVQTAASTEDEVGGLLPLLAVVAALLTAGAAGGFTARRLRSTR